MSFLVAAAPQRFCPGRYSATLSPDAGDPWDYKNGRCPITAQYDPLWRPATGQLVDSNGHRVRKPVSCGESPRPMEMTVTYAEARF